MRNVLFWSLLFLAAVLSYLPALRSFFVKDDLILILSAQTNFFTLLTHSWPGGFFRPAAELLFATQHAVFGLDPLPYHLLSLGVHTITTLLLYRLLLRLLYGRDQSRIGAIVFALHPLHTESVNWISGQMSLFAGLCTLLLLSCSNREHSMRFTAYALITIIGLGFYESFVAAPLLWLALYGCAPRMRRQIRPVSFVVTIILSSLLVGIYLYWRFGFLGLRGGNYTVVPSLGTALTNLSYYLYMLLGGSAIGGRIIYYYPEQLFSPSHFLYVFPPLFIATLILFVSAGILYVRRRVQGIITDIHMDMLLPVAWLLAALLPALILPERPRRLAYTSVPSLAILVAASFSYLQQGSRLTAAFTRTGLLLYLIIMATSLHARNRDWQSVSLIEKNIPALVSQPQACASLIIDAPNLLGDALFFNNLSTQRWIEQTTGKHLPVYDAHQLPPPPFPAIPTCSFLYVKGSFVKKDLEILPIFVRGKNWSPSPIE